MELNLCCQGPEIELTDFLGKLDANYACLKNLGAEVLDRDKRVALTTQMNASFRELAKHHTTRTPDIGSHQFCADLLLGEINNQALNLYEFNQPAPSPTEAKGRFSRCTKLKTDPALMQF